MLRIKIYSVGKTKETWLIDALSEYERRLRGKLAFEYAWAKDDAGLLRLLEKESRPICLDLTGKAYSSEQFAAFFEAELERQGARLCFVIGGAEGLPDSLRKRCTNKLCLSTLTLTHQMARLLLVEQIYRAVQILEGSPYHK